MEVADAIRAYGRRCEVIEADLGEPDTVADVARELEGADVDILVNNAGTISRAPLRDHGDDRWNQVMRLNLDAPFVLSRALSGPMAERGSGKIIAIASLLSFQGGINVVSYTAAKHGLVGVTRAMANELAPHGVQVNAIAPGYISTDNTKPLREDPDRNRAILERIPAGRWGTPQDLVGAAVFLASPASDYVNGHVLVVDGGWLSR